MVVKYDPCDGVNHINNVRTFLYNRKGADVSMQMYYLAYPCKPLQGIHTS